MNCPHCGFPQPDDRLAGLLPRRKRAIYEAVRESGQMGISCAELIQKVWGPDPRGRPQGMGAIYAHVVGINKVLEPFSLSIVHGWSVAGHYTLHRFGSESDVA